MGRRYITLPSFNAVAAGQVATINLATGPRYHGIKIAYKGNATKAVIEEHINMIRVKVNGNVQRAYKPSELFKILAQNGVPFRAGIIPIFFSEPWRRNVISEDTIAWATAGGVDTFQIEIEFSDAAVAPSLEAWASIDNVRGNLQNIIKVRRQTIPVQSIGDVTINTLTKKKGEQYHALHCFEEAAGDIGGIEVKLNGTEVYKVKKAINDAFLGERGIVAQGGLFSARFDATQRYEDSLPLEGANGELINDFSVVWDMTQANPFVLLSEVRGNPE